MCINNSVDYIISLGRKRSAVSCEGEEQKTNKSESGDRRNRRKKYGPWQLLVSTFSVTQTFLSWQPIKSLLCLHGNPNPIEAMMERTKQQETEYNMAVGKIISLQVLLGVTVS